MTLEEIVGIKRSVKVFNEDGSLNEIWISDQAEYPKLSQHVLDDHAADAENPAKVVPLENGKYDLRIVKGKGVYLFEGEKLIGFAELHGHRVADKVYTAIDLIYIIPEERSGKPLLIMLNAIRSVFKSPVLITDAVFKDGARALRLLKTRKSKFSVSLIDLDTGELSAYEPQANFHDDSKGVVIEGFGWPPYLKYRYVPPICPILFEWEDEIM